MDWYRADLHIHTVLSPCGDLDMSPTNIIASAKQKRIDIIAVTDHNSTRQSQVVMDLGNKAGITVIPGVEFNTSEEIHCLALFESIEKANEAQHFIDEHMGTVKNVPSRFGEQLLVDAQEHILGEEPILLIAALHADLKTIEKKVHALQGLFIPAHIDRYYNSLLSQLGFVPDDLFADAFEVSAAIPASRVSVEYGFIKGPIIRNSDAHHPQHMGRALTRYKLEEPSFAALKDLFIRRKTENIEWVC